MPYLDKNRKDHLDAGNPMLTAGDLTYMIQQLLKRYWVNSSRRYTNIAEILGAIEGAKADFWDRVGREYEEKKRYENGDAW